MIKTWFMKLNSILWILLEILQNGMIKRLNLQNQQTKTINLLKKAAANIVLAKCGAKVKVVIVAIFCRRCFSIPFSFCNFTALKKHRLRLVELEPKVLHSPALRQYFFR